MFKVNDKEIGTYISRLVEGKFDSARKFCIAYLKTDNVQEPTVDEIKRMENRIS